MKTEGYSGERAYDSGIASSYEDDRKVEKLWGLEQDYMQEAVRGMPAGSTLLDVPAGTGRFFPYYEAAKLDVLGVDISESMLAQARGKVTSQGIRLELGDARALSKPDGCFDYVICWRLLHLLPPDMLRPVVSELARVAARKLYLQAFVRDRWHLLLRIKARLARPFARAARRQERAGPAWSHIESFEHDETSLLRTFEGCGLSLSATDVLGSYGALKVKVYVLSKA